VRGRNHAPGGRARSGKAVRNRIGKGRQDCKQPRPAIHAGQSAASKCRRLRRLGRQSTLRDPWFLATSSVVMAIAARLTSGAGQARQQPRSSRRKPISVIVKHALATRGGHASRQRLRCPALMSTIIHAKLTPAVPGKSRGQPDAFRRAFQRAGGPSDRCTWSVRLNRGLALVGGPQLVHGVS